MHRTEALLTLALATAAWLDAAAFSGQQALEHTRALVALGPRPAGTPPLAKAQAYIVGQLRNYRWQVTEQAFTAKTPAGVLSMKNVIAFKKGSGGKAVAITGHYDTKRFLFPFVGANDGGASAGFLLEMARALAGATHKNDVYLVWLDGEEAVKEWTATDSLYGSRHLADAWFADGTLNRMSAVINVDMIGDKDLHIVKEMYSAEPLRRLVWQVAAQLGHARHFDGAEMAIEDDHAPFLRKGVRALDLIDFDYGPSHSWWHTRDDTMDKLSADSLQVVGDVLVETLKRLDQ
jgi:Zn-dependent M28 family amino/carboxypeptidase